MAAPAFAGDVPVIPGDDFADGCADIWALYENNPSVLEVREQNSRLQFPSNANPGVDATAGYISNGWGIEPNDNARLRFSWHLALPANTANVGLALGFSLESNPNPTAFQDAIIVYIGRDHGTWYWGIVSYVNGVRYVLLEEDIFLGNNGTIYFRYDAVLDLLYLSEAGYYDPGAIVILDLIGGLPIDQVTMFFGAYSEGAGPGVPGGQIWGDNFVIDEATLVAVTPIDAGGWPDGEIPDCNGNCAPVEWIGDGHCDDGTWLHNGEFIDLNCAAFDFDGGDCEVAGTADILWRHEVSGLVYTWLMNGTQRIGQGSVGTVGLAWDVVGLGDFDGPS